LALGKEGFLVHIGAYIIWVVGKFVQLHV
jgi:H+/Cl- antiporter ClcA